MRIPQLPSLNSSANIDGQDGHNDLLIAIRTNSSNRINSADFKDRFENGGYVSHVDIPRLDAGVQGGAFWSAFMPCPIGGNATDFSDDRYEPSTSRWNPDCTVHAN